MEHSMTKDEISLKVRQVISEVLDVPIEKVYESASLTSDLAADSLDAVEVVMELEEKFQVTLNDIDRSKTQTVNDLISHIMHAANSEMEIS